MTGAERAAALLVALGPESASDILKHLGEENINVLMAEVAKIGRLSPEEKEELIGEFLISIRKNKDVLQAGEESAKEILDKAFGFEKSSQILKKVSVKDLEKEFAFFKDADPEIIAQLIQRESSQITAVLLAYMPPALSAAVLKKFPSKIMQEVAVKMASLDSVVPEAVLDMGRKLKEKYKHYLENAKKGISSDGIASLLEIMSYMNNDDERKLMKNLEGSEPDISENIREKIIVFDTINNLTNNDIRILIDEINDDSLIAVALKGADENIRFRLLRNMSRNRATDLIEDMERLGAVRKIDAEDSRKEIVKIMRSLYENGAIHIPKPGEIYVE